jgi:hypothetical protein
MAKGIAGRLLSEYPVILALLALAVLNLLWSQSLRWPLTNQLFSDPDTIMRLIIVKSMHQGDWQRGFFIRSDAPFGMILHWSSLFAWMLLGATKLLWFLPFDRALLYVGMLTGPFLAALCLITAYVSARPIMSSPMAAMFGLAAVTSLDIVAYSQIGTASHHILILWVMLCLLGAAIRMELHEKGRLPAIMAGICAGLGIWISFESLIFVEVFFAYICLLWIAEGKRQADNILIVAMGICGIALAGFIIDPPYGGYSSIEIDRLSLPYVFAFGMQLASVLVTRALAPNSPLGRAACVAACAIASLAIQMGMFPIADLMRQVNPFVMEEWASSITEFNPVRSLWRGFQFLGNGVLGVIAILLIKNLSTGKKILYALCLTALGVGTFNHIRYSPYFWALGSFAALYAIDSMRRSSKLEIRNASPWLAAYLSIYVLAGNYFVSMYLRHHPPRFMGYASADCHLEDVLPAIRNTQFLGLSRPDHVFVTDLDNMQKFLFYTDYRTLAGNYHSDARGINDMYLMMRDPGWNLAHQVVEEHEVDFMLLCPTGDRARFGVTDSELYWKYSTPTKEFRQPTFYTRILGGDLPPWLIQRQWPAGTKTDLKLFQVFDSPSPPGKNS